MPTSEAAALRTFPWKAATAVLECEQPKTKQEEGKSSAILRWLYPSAFEWEESYATPGWFAVVVFFFSFECSFVEVIFFFFSNCLGLELFVVFCADFTQLKWSSHGPSLSLMTLRNPNTCYKKKIKLQNILRCTDALCEGRWSQGRHAWGRELSEISWTAEGSLFADHRSAVPLSRDTFGAERGGAYIFFLRCQSCAKSLTCFTLQINVLWSRYY